MKKIRSTVKHNPFLLFVMLSIIFFFSLASNAAPVSAQTKGNKVITTLNPPVIPIEIVSLQANQKQVKIDEPFQQDSDWLKDFTVTYKNNSGKNIIWVSIGMDFLETRATGNLMVFPLVSGPYPMYSPTIKEIIPVKSGEKSELKLTQRQYEVLKEFIGKRHQLDSLTQVRLRLDFILYDDETGWTAGENVRRSDPNHPKMWIPFDAKKQE